MKRDAFSCCHPAVNFIFFIGALGFGVVIQHPAYLLAGMAGAFSYFLLLRGLKGLKQMAMLLPLFLAVALLNPLLNHAGSTLLFSVFGIPYTLEALVYGGVLAGMFFTMLLWFSCYSVVLTGDKFTSLFGNLIPSLSLLLTMILRLVPHLIRKGKQIVGARQSLGKELSNTTEGMVVLGCLTTWALEGSIVTADSMRSRGYGTMARTSFMIYRMTIRDWVLLGIILVTAGWSVIAAATGQTTASFTPTWYIAPVSLPSLLVYLIFSLIPTFLHLQEAVSWHISRSRI